MSSEDVKYFVELPSVFELSSGTDQLNDSMIAVFYNLFYFEDFDWQTLPLDCRKWENMLPMKIDFNCLEMLQGNLGLVFLQHW